MLSNCNYTRTMPDKKLSKDPDASSELSARAKELLKQKNLSAGSSALSNASSPEEMLQLIHEFSVHQIELEIQQQEQLKLRAELEKSLHRYVDLYDFAPTGYLTLQSDTTILEVNLQAASILGVDQSQLKGNCLQAFIIDEDLPVLNTLMQNVFSKRDHQYCEVTLLSKETGQPGMQHKTSGHILRIDALLSTDTQECRVSLTDVTEQMHAHEVMKKSEERFRKMFEEHSAIMFIIDPDTGLIVKANHAASRFYGWSINELRSMRIQQINTLSPEAIQVAMEKSRTGEENHFVFQHHLADGELRAVEVYSITIELSGKVLLYSIIHDITEQKKLLHELVTAKQHAEENDRLKSAFLANISHEIRTPMNGILGFSQLLKESHLTGEEQAEYIDLIYRSGQRMLKLINDLIDISRIEAGETMVQITQTTVNELLRDLKVFFMPQSDTKGLRLQVSTGLPDRDSIIETDSAKLTQILTNLIQNALKFTTEGGIDVGYARQNDMLGFYVSDTGIGIPQDMQVMVFERFHQVNNTLTRNYEGSGLGLSISRAYVAMLGGTIRVESVEGKGSKFSFTLPYKPAHELNLPQQPFPVIEKLPDVVQNITTVLIAEDDVMSSLLLTRSLKAANITMLTAVNGQEAVELVQDHPEIDVVLMDIKMPIMNGFDATKLIKQQRPDLPVIVQSAYTSKEDKEKSKNAGADAFITKPINKTELLQLITKLLKH